MKCSAYATRDECGWIRPENECEFKGRCSAQVHEEEKAEQGRHWVR